LPVLNRYFRMNDYRDATNGLAIEKSVHLEADVDEPFMLEGLRAKSLEPTRKRYWVIRN
jgi:hypothetical protein